MPEPGPLRWRYDDLKDVIAKARGREFGLAASVRGKPPGSAIAERLEGGMVRLAHAAAHVLE